MARGTALQPLKAQQLLGTDTIGVVFGISVSPKNEDRIRKPCPGMVPGRVVMKATPIGVHIARCGMNVIVGYLGTWCNRSCPIGRYVLSPMSLSAIIRHATTILHRYVDPANRAHCPLVDFPRGNDWCASRAKRLTWNRACHQQKIMGV